MSYETMPFIRSYDGTRGLALGEMSPLGYAWSAASILSTAAGAYHGYKRNDSVGWAIVWGLLGGLFPVITPAIAAAHGFGERRKS